MAKDTPRQPRKVCIPPSEAAKLKSVLNKTDELDSMSSEERIAFFKESIQNDEVVEKLNRGYESRLTSTKKDIRKDYLKRFANDRGFTPVQKDLVEKIDSIKDILNPADDAVFAKSLAEHKLGVSLTREQSKKIVEMTDEVLKLRDKASNDLIGKTPDEIFRMEPSDRAILAAKAEGILERYVGDLSLANPERVEGITNNIKKAASGFKDAFTSKKGARDASNKVADEVVLLAGTAKAATASFDNSFFGRQGIKTLMFALVELPFSRVPIKNWLKNFGTSFSDIGKTIKTAKFSDDAMALGFKKREQTVMDNLEDMTKADYVYQTYMKNAKGGFGISGVEEAFPTNFMEEIPGIGRAYKATEVAYNAAAIRMRLWLGKYNLEMFSKAGIDISDPEIVDVISELVSSMTGKGQVSQAVQGAVGSWYFSIKLFTSMIDTIWMPTKFLAKGLTKPGTTEYDAMVRQAYRKAALQSAKPLIGWAAMLGAAAMVGGSSLDPRDKRFGKVVLPDGQTFDITGGNLTFWGGITKIISGKQYDPNKGTWVQNSQLSGDKWGQVLQTVFTNRLGPVPALVRDAINGEHFGGEPITPTSIASNLIIPITVKNVFEEGFVKKDYSSAMYVLLGEGFGFNTRNMKIAPRTQEWSALRDTNMQDYNSAVADLNEQFLPLAQKYRKDEDFQALPESEQTKLITTELNRIQKEILAKYQDGRAKAESKKEASKLSKEAERAREEIIKANK